MLHRRARKEIAKRKPQPAEIVLPRRQGPEPGKRKEGRNKQNFKKAEWRATREALAVGVSTGPSDKPAWLAGAAGAAGVRPGSPRAGTRAGAPARGSGALGIRGSLLAARPRERPGGREAGLNAQGPAPRAHPAPVAGAERGGRDRGEPGTPPPGAPRPPHVTSWKPGGPAPPLGFVSSAASGPLRRRFPARPVGRPRRTMAELCPLAEELSCSICLEPFKDPVTTPCGHNFCGACLDETWAVQGAPYLCPQCRTGFPARPQLRKNTVLCAVVEQFLQAEQARPALAADGWTPPTRAAAPSAAGQVACDHCLQATAVKTCLVCMASFCQEHLRPHLDSPAFQDHPLQPPVRDLMRRKCARHNRLRDFFCPQHSECICHVCVVDHKTCSPAPLNEASTDLEVGGGGRGAPRGSLGRRGGTQGPAVGSVADQADPVGAVEGHPQALLCLRWGQGYSRCPGRRGRENIQPSYSWLTPLTHFTEGTT